MDSVFANARRYRNQNHLPDATWTLPGNPLKIDVHAQRVGEEEGGEIHRLDVRFGDGMVRLLSVERIEVGEAKPEHQASAYPREPKIGSMVGGEFSLYFRVPKSCNLEDNRRPVRVKIRYERIGEKSKKPPTEEIIDLDVACLIGDGLKWAENGNSLESLASAYIHDPALQAFVAKAKPLPRLSAYKELTRLGEWISHLYVSDPGHSLDLKARYGELYAFSPSETLRYGGDCEDWVIVASGYLAALGYNSYVHSQLGHVFSSAGFLRSEWVFAGDPNQFRSFPLDFTDGSHAPLWLEQQWIGHTGYLPKNSSRAWVNPGTVDQDADGFIRANLPEPK